jgi:hypothetical protein
MEKSLRNRFSRSISNKNVERGRGKTERVGTTYPVP